MAEGISHSYFVASLVQTGDFHGANMKKEQLRNQHSFRLSEAIDRAMCESGNSTWKASRNRFRAIEEEFVKEATNNRFVVIETRRRIAEAMLMVGIGMKCSFNILKDLFGRLRTAGFTDLDRRLTFSVILARECCDTGHFRYGIRVMQELIENTGNDDERVTKKAIRLAEQVIQELKLNQQRREKGPGTVL